LDKLQAHYSLHCNSILHCSLRVCRKPGMEWNIEYSMENRNYGMEYRNYGMEYRNYGMEYRNYGMEYMDVWYNLTKFINFILENHILFLYNRK
jgi:hypothetical protein